MKQLLPVFCLAFAFSCHNTGNALAKNKETNPPLPAQVIAEKNMQQQGIDFIAQGNAPVNWQLQLNYDDSVRFSAEDGLKLSFGCNRLKRDMNAERTTFTGKINNADVTIVITEGTCTVPTMREVFHKLVTFSFNSKQYTGCGKFLADNTLNAKWLLEKVGNTAILPEDYNRIPVFQFNVEAGRFSGNDGCNTISGKIEVQGNRIKFDPIIETKMACMKKSIEKIIAANVSDKLVNYYFRNAKLYLYLPDDSLLVFGKGN